VEQTCESSYGRRLDFTYRAKHGRIEPGGAFFEQSLSLSLSLSLIRELCVFSRSYLVWSEFLNFLKIAQKFRV